MSCAVTSKPNHSDRRRIIKVKPSYAVRRRCLTKPISPVPTKPSSMTMLDGSGTVTSRAHHDINRPNTGQVCGAHERGEILKGPSLHQDGRTLAGSGPRWAQVRVVIRDKRDERG